MKIIKTINDFLLDKICEALVDNNGEIQFIMSDKLITLIGSIAENGNPIANKLMLKRYATTPVTLIDITDKNDMVSFVNSPKIIDFLNNFYNIDKTKMNNKSIHSYMRYFTEKEDSIWEKFRSEIKIGKLIKKMFGDHFPVSGNNVNTIETFVNKYKSTYDKMFNFSTDLFEIVEDNDIIKWYNKENYSSGSENSTLDQSCMAHDTCEGYLKFYAINSPIIRMLIMYDNKDKNKIIGRSLIWKIGGNDEYSGRYLMDRIYTQQIYQIDHFIEYAEKNGWLYKTYQEAGEDSINDSETDDDFFSNLVIDNIKPSRWFPYLDTFRYYNYYEKRLSIDYKNNEDLKLIDTEGDIYNAEYSNYYNRWIAVYNSKSNYVQCNLGTSDWEDGDKFRKKEDATYINGYKDYVPNDIKDDVTFEKDGLLFLKPKYL